MTNRHPYLQNLIDRILSTVAPLAKSDFEKHGGKAAPVACLITKDTFDMVVIPQGFIDVKHKELTALAVRKMAQQRGAEAVVMIADSFTYDVGPEVIEQMGLTMEEFKNKVLEEPGWYETNVRKPEFRKEALAFTLDTTYGKWAASYPYRRERCKFSKRDRIIWIEAAAYEVDDVQGRMTDFINPLPQGNA